MGYTENPEVGVGLEMEDKKWVIGGIPLRAPLKRIRTNPMEAEEKEIEECSTTTRTTTTTTKTPTGEEARIPSRLVCPPPPRKRKPSLKCNYGVVREFFTPPDLETVFIPHTC